MDNFDIPIFKKAYSLYKTLHDYRKIVPKSERFTIFERCENSLLELIELILLASSQGKDEKLPALNKASLKLNLLRVFIRLLKDIKAIDNKKYVNLESLVDEIGRMLGGWIRASKDG